MHESPLDTAISVPLTLRKSDTLISLPFNTSANFSDDGKLAINQMLARDAFFGTITACRSATLSIMLNPCNDRHFMMKVA